MVDTRQLREQARQTLEELDWGEGLSRAGMLRQLLERGLSLPAEVRLAIPSGRVFAGPEQVIAAVPDRVWEEHARRVAEARGTVDLPEQTERPRDAQVN